MRKVTKAAVAAAVLLTGGGVSADAADMSFPPAYRLDSEPMVEFGSGWYLRGDLGYATISRPSYGYSVTDPMLVSTAPGALVGDPMRRDGILGSTVGLGYAFNRWFRSDVTFDWRQNVAGTFSQLFTPSGGAGGCVISDQSVTDKTTGIATLIPDLTSCYKTDKTQIRSWSGLVNVYGDLGTWFNITPYVGGGIGLSNLRTSTSEDWFFSNGVPYQSSAARNTWCTTTTKNCYSVGYRGPLPAHDIRTNFSFALMAGIAYDLGPHLKLDIGYRYLNMGSMTVVDANGNQARRTLETQEVRAGLRWTPDL
jgi:opacity protein-like surface antigen